MQPDSTSPQAATASTLISVPVKAFCAFVAKSGDLDLRFTPVPTAEEGNAGHKAVVWSRRSDYRAEVVVQGTVDGLRLSGRVDGMEADGRTLDEIKTHRGPVERIPANHTALHWAQLRTYGALWAMAHGLESVRLRLCYFDVDERRETQLEVEAGIDELTAELAARVAVYKAWMARERAHRQRRDTLLDALDFPHPQIHAGQAQLMAACERAILNGGGLLAQAPTGTGKTLGVLFPALKGLAAGRLDRIAYLTARNTVQAEVVRTLRGLAEPGRPVPLRVLVLSARERACVYPDRACHGEACPRARGFYDRLPAAREAARSESVLSPSRLKALAADHQVCPYFLAQEMARWADLVIGDVNYAFDSHALLHALAEQYGWRSALLVDEGHHLVDRARDMYSASLSQSRLREIARGTNATVARALSAVDRVLDDAASLAEVAAADEGVRRQWPKYGEEPPRALRGALQDAIRAFGKWFAEDPARGAGEPLALYFELIGLLRLIETFGTHSIVELEDEGARAGDLFDSRMVRLSILNVVPAPHLADRLQTAHCVLVFSATLAPADYHRQMLGLAPETPWCDAPSAFSPDQLAVRVVRNIPTRYRERHRGARPMAALIAETWRRRPGNYLAFFSSFAWLAQVAAVLAREHPDVPLLRQEPSMDATARAGFLQRFAPEGRLVGMAVLGGSFAEGIDLPGRRLVGAFICNLGLPPASPRLLQMARQVDRWFGPGTGEDYVFLYPAVTKVVQAAGRVIRSHADRGSLHLVDARFGREPVLPLLPASWGLRRDAG